MIIGLYQWRTKGIVDSLFSLGTQSAGRIFWFSGCQTSKTAGRTDK